MVIIRFHNEADEHRALGFLIGRFTLKSWDDGRTMVPEPALAALEKQGIAFIVEGPAKYEDRIPFVRNPSAATVQ